MSAICAVYVMTIITKEQKVLALVLQECGNQIDAARLEMEVEEEE